MQNCVLLSEILYAKIIYLSEMNDFHQSSTSNFEETHYAFNRTVIIRGKNVKISFLLGSRVIAKDAEISFD